MPQSQSQYLKEELWSEENIDEAKPDESWQTGAQHPSQVEILPVGGHQGGSWEKWLNLFILHKNLILTSETGEDCGGDEESSWHKAGVHRDGQLEERSHTKTSQKSKSHQHRHSGAAILAVIRGHEETYSQSSSDQWVENASATKEISAQVDVGPGRGGQHRHGEAGVDVLQVGPHMRLTANNKIK